MRSLAQFFRGETNKFNPDAGVSNLPGVKFRTKSKNRWGKKYITHDYTPVGGEWPKTRERHTARICIGGEYK